MDYIQQATEIFEWLSSFQIDQPPIAGTLIGNRLTFNLQIPGRGEVKVDMPLPEEKYFLCHGIGMKIFLKKNGNFVLDCYDDGGIFDEIDNSIPGTHYATTHFALLGAILFTIKQDDQILLRVKRAIKFHLRTLVDEYRFDSWYYHWDFKNYAFLETYYLLQNNLTDDEKNEWQRALKKTRENIDNRLTNWLAMRTYFVCLRYQLFKKFTDKVKYEIRKRNLFRARLSDGSFDDQKKVSRVIQYHIYTTALLHRIYQITKKVTIKNKFIEGVNYFLQFVDPEGGFNYLGRGQQQIFGYAAAIYALEAAKKVDPKNAVVYQYYLNRLNSCLYFYKRDKHFPLVLNNRNDKEKFGWYDYHHLTVYNAFLGAWLGLTALLKTVTLNESKPNFPKIKVSIPSQVAFIRNENIFISIFGGLPEYLTEAGLTIQHLWFSDVGVFFSCPGGASKEKFGKTVDVENIERNCFAPIALTKKNELIIPALKRGKVNRVNKSSVLASLDYGPFFVERLINVKNEGAYITDVITVLKDDEYSEFRFINVPINLSLIHI